VALRGPSSVSRNTSCRSRRCSESSQLRSTATLSWATWPLAELVSLLLGVALQRHATHLASSTRILLAQVSTWACALYYVVVCSDHIVDPSPHLLLDHDTCAVLSTVHLQPASVLLLKPHHWLQVSEFINCVWLAYWCLFHVQDVLR
jgi:hypothetical protein